MPDIFSLIQIVGAIALIVAFIRGLYTKNYTPAFCVLAIVALSFISHQFFFTIKNSIELNKVELQRIEMQGLISGNNQLCDVNVWDYSTWHCGFENSFNDMINTFFGNATNFTSSAIGALTDGYLFQIRTDLIIKVFEGGFFMTSLTLSLAIYVICFSYSLLKLMVDVWRDNQMDHLPAKIRQKIIDMVTVLPMLLIPAFIQVAIIYAFGEVNLLLQSDKFVTSFIGSFRPGGIANMVGGALWIYLLIAIGILIISVLHTKYNFELVFGVLSSSWAVAISPLASDSTEINYKNTFATCCALLFGRFPIVLSFKFMGDNLAVNLVLLCVGLWTAITLRSQFEKYLANYSMSFDLSTISQITGRATNSVSRFASNMSRPVQVGTERLKSYNHDMEGGKRGYTYREKPIMSTRGEVLKNRIKNKLTSFGK